MKKMKWAALLAMLLAAILPCAALAAPGDANIARQEEMSEKYRDGVYGGCVAGDTLYLYGGEHIYTYRIGDADVTAVEFQLPEPGEDEYRSVQRMFSDGETLYLLCTLTYYGDESYSLRSAQIYPLKVEGDEVSYGEPMELDTSDLLVSYGGDEEYFVQVNAACCVDGYLMMYVYNDNGEQALYALDMASGEGGYVEDVERIESITPYSQDELLIQTYDYESGCYEFLLYDPASESMTSACAPVERDGSMDSMAYSQESGRLFYMHGGYVMAAEDFDFANAEPVAELSTLYYSENGGLLLPGDYYVNVSYEATAIRSTDPDAMPEKRIIVRGSGYSDAIMAAYYSFGNAHSDVAVVLDQTYMRSSALIEAMMSRDASADVYMMSVSSEAYDALYNRGYMAEVDNEEVVAAVQGMYPAVQEVLTRDGEVIAVPVSVYGWTLGLDYEGFEKIGIAREDVPDNWPALLELLPELPDMLPEDGSVRIFEEYYTQQSVRENLLGVLLQSWRIHQNAAGREVDYDSPELIEMMDTVMTMDFEAMGLPEDDEDEEERYYEVRTYGGDERSYTLIETSVGCTIGNFYSRSEPALMSVIPGEPGEVVLSMTVAFVNPFSENPELAQEYLAELVKNMENSTAYNVSDALNEPVRYTHMLDQIQMYQEDLEELNAELESADPVDVPDIKEGIANIEEILADIDQYGWEIPERDIEWYRAHAEYLTVDRYDFLDAADEDGELSDLAEQFLAGRVSAEEFLTEIARKVRMRALEGN